MPNDADHTKPHMHDFEAHVRAVEEDLEYYRAKRFEPRLIYLARRGVITFYDILKAKTDLDSRSRPLEGSESSKDIESRIRFLEDALDDYVKGIALISGDAIKGVDAPIDDTRIEAGYYDEFFRIAHKERKGTLEERIERLEKDVRDYRMLLDVYTRAAIQKGLTSREELDRRLDAVNTQDARNGGRIVARAWLNPEFKADLIARGREVVRELGIPPGRLGKLGVVENTESVHNVVVCTLCSCYPRDLLGDTPWWYKHDIYKKRIIADPRGVLAEMFGLKIPAGMEVRVCDSTSDVRYMVLPRRPRDTEGMSEEELAQLVTIDSLIGAGEPLHPSDLKEKRITKQVRL